MILQCCESDHDDSLIPQKHHCDAMSLAKWSQITFPRTAKMIAMNAMILKSNHNDTLIHGKRLWWYCYLHKVNAKNISASLQVIERNAMTMHMWLHVDSAIHHAFCKEQITRWNFQGLFKLKEWSQEKAGGCNKVAIAKRMSTMMLLANEFKFLKTQQSTHFQLPDFESKVFSSKQRH